MCGFSGEVRFDTSPADLAAVTRMADALRSRGPDGSGSWSAGPAALGHRRLAVIDLSAKGAQPMVDSELGLTIAFNGCIYNYRDLRDRLTTQGYRFFSNSDTEVILKAYHRWGTRAVEQLVGMFAFAIVEHGSGRVVLARDRLGIKPLYLARTSGRLRFASTLPALVAGGDVDTSVDPVALHHYLSWHAVVPPPYTILRGVRKLPPATVRVIESDGTSTDRVYWRPEYTRHPEYGAMSPADWADATLAALRTAVERRLVADVPVGVLLSGGLDSSLVVGLLAEAGQDRLATFSIGFESSGGQEGDEFAYSDIVAQRFGTDHHRMRVPTSRLLPALDGAIHAMSEPMVSHDAVAFFLLAQEVSRHVTVVQSGQGADEVFAGYHWYPRLAGVPREQAASTYARVFFDRGHADMAGLLNPEWRVGSDVSGAFVDAHMNQPGAETTVDAALRLDTEIMLADDPVKRVDNMTMAWGLEARVPFLDHDLVELAAAAPPSVKLADGGKGVLKAAARRLLPPQVIDRRKGYFPVPALTRLDGPLLDRVVEAVRAPEAKARGLFDDEYVADLVKDPNRKLTPLRGNRLWQLGLLEMWLQSHDLT